MKDAGIRNPESTDGIVFCLNYCPYDRCVVYETEYCRAESLERRANKAKELETRGYDIRTIAKIMNIGPGTVKRYLAK